MTQTRGDASLLITGVRLPNLNGVLTVRSSVKAADVSVLLDVAASKGLPHSIQVRPGCPPDLIELARSRGMVEDEPVPLMAMRGDIEALRAAADLRAFSVRLLEPEEAGLHASVGAEGFEAPLEMFQRLVPPPALRQPGFRAYVGMVDGEPVTTALSSTVGHYVGIFNVATPPRHRGRGYGAAITARATLDGLEAGASFAYLQSSPMGFKIYERLGFRTLETWSVWITPDRVTDPSRS